MTKRPFLKALLAAAALTGYASGAFAQNTPIKFQLDWRFEGPAAFFLHPVAQGYFKDAKLDVTVDAGNGSGGAVTLNGQAGTDTVVARGTNGDDTIVLDATTGDFHGGRRGTCFDSRGLVPCAPTATPPGFKTRRISEPARFRSR